MVKPDFFGQSVYLHTAPSRLSVNSLGSKGACDMKGFPMMRVCLCVALVAGLACTAAMAADISRRAGEAPPVLDDLRDSPVGSAQIRLVAVNTFTGTNEVTSLPASLTAFNANDVFYLEVWAQTDCPDGLASVSLDITYDPGEVSLVPESFPSSFEPDGIYHTPLFTNLTNYDVTVPGLVDNLSGSYLPTGGCSTDPTGVAPQWSRVAVLKMEAQVACTPQILAGATGDVLYGTSPCGTCGGGEGNFDPGDLVFEGVNDTATGDLLLNVAAGSEVVEINDTVTVTLDVANLSHAVNGVQALMHYDTTMLTLVDIVPNGAIPWTEVAQIDTPGDIAYSATIQGGSTQADGTAATLTFTTIAAGTTSVTFLPDNPTSYPSLVNKLTRADTAEYFSPTATDSGDVIVLDGTQCYIDGAYKNDGDLNPLNDCEWCDPATDPEAWTSVPSGEACGDQSDTACDNPDTCDGAGTCQPNYEPTSTTCGDAAADCVNQDYCDGAGSCQDYGYWAVDTPCGSSDDTECDNPDTCDNAGTCLTNYEPTSTTCGDAAADCVNQDYCDGAGLCQDYGYWTVDTPCGSSDDTECDNPDTCDNAGTCLTNYEPTSTTCGDAAADCVNQDYCDGAGSCQDYGYWAVDTLCGSPDDTECDNPDTCDDAGTCLTNYEPTSTTCGDAAADCVNQDYCDGAGLCQDYGYWAVDTPCGDGSDTDCTDPDSCNDSGVCVANHAVNGAPCEDGEYCTIDEYCTDGTCGDGLPRDCGDAFACTDDSCDDIGDTCVNMPNDGNCDDSNDCTADTCSPATGDPVTGCEYDDLTYVDIAIDIQALSGAVSRDVTLVVTDCGVGTDTEVHNVSFTSGSGTIHIEDAALWKDNADWIQVTEGHTLSRTLPLVFDSVDGCSASPDFIGADELLSGDFSNAWVAQDNLVDITDFSILSIEWNQPVDPNLGFLADATGDGVQNVADFTAIQANFAEVGDLVDGCAKLGYPSPMDLARPQFRVNVGDLPMPDAYLADENNDGVVDVRDIRRFAARNGLPLLPAFKAKLDLLEFREYGEIEFEPGGD